MKARYSGTGIDYTNDNLSRLLFLACYVTPAELEVDVAQHVCINIENIPLFL